MKKVISALLVSIMLLSVVCIAPISASAEGFTKLNAVKYGILNKYTVTDSEKDSDGDFIVGGIQLDPNCTTAQTYESMQSIGFVDKTNIPYVAFKVSAPEDGSYKIKTKYNMGLGTSDGFGDGYFNVVAVNDVEVYKSPVVMQSGEYTDDYTVKLKKGVNIIRILTAVGENFSINPWCNVHALYIEDTLTGIEKGTDIALKTGNATYFNDYNANTSSGTLGGVDVSTVKEFAYTYDSLKIGSVDYVPYFSYTVDVPLSGYYDMSLEFYTGVIGATGYFVLFVDSVKQKVNFIDNQEWYSTVAISAYIPAGTHTITVTSAMGHSTEFYRAWCDFSAFRFHGGDVTESATQIDPVTINDPTRLEAETQSYNNGYTTTEGAGSGGVILGGANWDYGNAQSFAEIQEYFDKSNMLYLTFAVNAPADGSYTLKPGYYWSSSATSHFATVLVNDDDAYKATFVNQGTSGFNAGSINVTLNKGRNIIRVIPFTSDSNAGTGWINYDYLDIDPSLTAADAKSYNRAEAENSSFYGNIEKNAAGQLGNSEIFHMQRAEIKADTFTKNNLTDMPYFTLTVNAPADGWYDMTALVSPEKLFSTSPDYLGVIIDNTNYVYPFRGDTANGNVSDSERYNVNKIDLTTYLTAGEHNLIITAPAPLSTGGGRYMRINFDAVLLYGGLTVSDTQTDPKPDLSVYYEAEDAYLHQYQVGVAENESWHGKNCAFAGSANYTYNVSAEMMPKYLEQNAAYVAFTVEAPADGNYSMQLRFKLGCSSDEQYDSYAEKNGKPYASVVVNGQYYKALHNGKNGWISLSDVLSVSLKKGINVIYAFATTKELEEAIGGVYIDYDYLLMDDSLKAVEHDLYYYGDTNNDKFVNIKDVLRMKKFMADPKTECNEGSANISGDSAYIIDATDVSMLCRMIVDPVGSNEMSWLKLAGQDGDTGITALRSSPYVESWLVDVGDAVTVHYADQIPDGNYTIDVTSTQKQYFEGFGAAMTETSGYNLSFLGKEERTLLMNDLFSSSTGDALNLKFLRQPLGCSDFSVGTPYTYDDVSGDTSLSYFSISRDDKYIIPNIKEAQAINSSLEFVGGVWTAPIWMKTSESWNTASGNVKLSTSYYSTYSNYVVKALSAYKDRGIFIKYLSAQNEPDGNHTIPSTWYDNWAMQSLVNGYLYPAIQNSGIGTKLIAYDFNWFDTNTDNIDRIKGFIKGPSGYLDGKNYGIAFHPYMFNAEVQSVIHNLYPDMPIYVTEAAGNSVHENFFNSANKTVSSLRNYAAMYLYWNIMLDENAGPYLDGMGGGGIGLTEYDTDTGRVKKLSDYYALAHYSKFIDPGAYIVDSTATHDLQYVAAGSNQYTNYVGLMNVAAVNPDGTYSIVVTNTYNKNTRVKILIGNGLALQYNVPAESAVSISWNPATVSQYVK